MKSTRVLKPNIPGGPARRSARGGRLRRAVAWLTSTMLYALALGLALGGLVHIVTVFAIPLVGSSDAVSRLSRELAPDAPSAQTGEIGAGGFVPPWPDPAFVTTYCRFDLTRGPQRISARAGDGFAGLSLHGQGGGVLYAVTDEIAQDGELVLLVLTPEQAADDPGEAGAEVRFVAPVNRGIATTTGLAVYRVLAPLPSLREKARETAASLRCEEAAP